MSPTSCQTSLNVFLARGNVDMWFYTSWEGGPLEVMNQLSSFHRRNHAFKATSFLAGVCRHSHSLGVSSNSVRQAGKLESPPDATDFSMLRSGKWLLRL